MIKNDLVRIEQKVDSIIEMLNPTDTPERGVVVRLDRLEQSERRRNWWTRTAVGAWVTALIGFVGTKLFGFPS